MDGLKCPHCGEMFEISDDHYSSILRQVRDKEFQNELDAMRISAERERNAAVEIAVLKTKADTQAVIAEQNAKLTQLTADSKLAISDAIESQRLKYESELRLKSEEVERLKDMKLRLSTKMLGETLEQHCELAFEQVRMIGFMSAEFIKDNDAKTGSKGDYIFRDFDENGTEFVSIMFEMKNEADATATKQKNEQFLKELDKDRREKNCEYAVLVTMLEAESEFYNAGIVDMSHKYPKLYVIRPQFFIPLITLLRNAALRSLEFRQELARVRSQNIDVTNFEENLEKFKTGFSRNYDIASRKFEEAISEIDKAIDRLQKAKDGLLSSDRQLRLANDKAQDVRVDRLVRGNPTMQKAFADARTMRAGELNVETDI